MSEKPITFLKRLAKDPLKTVVSDEGERQDKVQVIGIPGVVMMDIPSLGLRFCLPPADAARLAVALVDAAAHARGRPLRK